MKVAIFEHSILVILEVIFLDTVNRIFDLADAQFREQREFAAALGLAPSIISAWRKRKLSSYSKYLPKIADTLGTSVQWLLTGEEHGGEQTDSLDKLAPAERQIILAYRRADDRARSMVDLALEPFKVPSQSDKAM